MTRSAVIGGGILGLTLALRLAQRGVPVDLIEAAPQLGGLAGSFDYGEFVWDRFYHCILPTDERLIGLLGELGLADELRWTRTGTGYHSGGQTWPMSGNRDFLAFPLLSLWQKARLFWVTQHARRFADPQALFSLSAEDWLTRHCGRRAYEVFWQPLLRAKFGPYHDRVAAAFIWATITRLFKARSGAAKAEHLGYVRGGYERILGAYRSELERLGARLRTATRATSLRERSGGVRLGLQTEGADVTEEDFAQVFVTLPGRQAGPLLGAELEPLARQSEHDYPSGTTYLGVISCNLVLDRPLTSYYVLNLAAPDVELTGVIEITNLIEAGSQTAGRSLVYLPRYLPSDSPEFERSDDELRRSFLERGLARVFPDLPPECILSSSIHRARYVQALPLVREGAPRRQPPPNWRPGVTLLNTAMLECATLNNDEVVGLVDSFMNNHAQQVTDLAGRGAEV